MAVSGSVARKKLVVIGNGMAACRLLDELTRLAPDLYQITVFSAEAHPGYNRVLLSPVLSGENDVEGITTHPLKWYRERRIRLLLDNPIREIDRSRRRVRSNTGEWCDYDRLVIATGARPRRLNVAGADAGRILTFRDLRDTARLVAEAERGGPAVVIGGGFLGIEAAEGLRRRGMDVTLVHSAGHLLNRQLDAEAGALLERDLSRRGLVFAMNGRTAAFEQDSCGDVCQVNLDDGRKLPANLVVQAIGIEPDLQLARASGLATGRAIRVDDTMQTYDPAIYAVGECVEHRSRTFGLVAPLYEQAAVCATHLAEYGHRRYRFQDTPTRLKVSGISVYSAGEFENAFGGSVLVLRDPVGGAYRRLVLRNSRIVGIVLYGDTRDAAFYERLMLQQTDVSTMRDLLLFGERWCVPPPDPSLEQAA